MQSVPAPTSAKVNEGTLEELFRLGYRHYKKKEPHGGTALRFAN